jgi:hypothetical protein
MSLIFRDRSPSVEDDDPGERVVRRRGAKKGQSTTRKTHRAPAKQTAAEPKVSKSNVRSLLSASQQASEPSGKFIGALIPPPVTEPALSDLLHLR